jgi:hypothetical protein
MTKREAAKTAIMVSGVMVVVAFAFVAGVLLWLPMRLLFCLPRKRNCWGCRMASICETGEWENGYD